VWLVALLEFDHGRDRCVEESVASALNIAGRGALDCPGLGFAG
jgi:hypothetical protein